MTDFSTVGFISNNKKTISFTIPLDKPVIAEEIVFDSMDIEIRSYEGLLINEDVIQGNYSVISYLKPLSVFVEIVSPVEFGTLNDIPLSIYIKHAEGTFI